MKERVRRANYLTCQIGHPTLVMPGLTGHLSGHKIRTDFADGYLDFEAPFYLLKYTYAAAWPGRSKGKPWQTLPLELGTIGPTTSAISIRS